jgi:hypothetical protein
MATYASYKKLYNDNIDSSTITDLNFDPAAGKNAGTLWVAGAICQCTTGCCFQWTVPNYVKKATFEAWGAGGNGSGACSCNRCHHYSGAQGGYYNTKTVDTNQGCQYTVCAGGVYRCLTRNCCGCIGNTSFVTGFNLSNFCAIGGHGGVACTDWSGSCYSCFPCCLAPGANGGDFGMGNHRGNAQGSWLCHCLALGHCTTGAPFLSGKGTGGFLRNCWIRCGCWTSPYATGGQSAMTTYCGSGCCGQGNTGGSGVVKITYL